MPLRSLDANGVPARQVLQCYSSSSASPGTEIAARDRPDARGGQDRRRGAAPVPRDGQARASTPSRSTRPSRPSTPSHGATPCSRAIPADKVPFPASHLHLAQRAGRPRHPRPAQIRDGDLLKIDTACKLNGWCADAAITHPGRRGPPGAAAAGRGRPSRCCGSPSRRCRAAAGGPRWPSRMQQHAEAGRLQRGRAVRRPRHRPHHAREPAGAQLRQPRAAQARFPPGAGPGAGGRGLTFDFVPPVLPPAR